ncbi:MAG: FAD:protein FMN transferase [Candidatus Omnitrophota bacterium]|nr:FAD:protein FMN transferase [Candidatus Omnitrophota bacterium]
MKKVLFSAFCLLLVTLLFGCQDKTLHKDTQVMMGTFVEVISPDKEAPNIVFTEIRRVENLLSKYKEDSEIAKLNKLGKLKVGPETFYVLQKAKDFWQFSEGVLDITVGPLVDLWGFSDKKYYLPKDKEIKQALSRVGFDKIIFNIDDNMVEFKIPGMKIDLGAIAKGYAVDCAVRKLKEHQIKSCLINAGGQIYCLGDKFGRPWRIAVRGPRNKGFWDYLKLKDEAVATSGDYEQYFMNKGKRYAHIVNPKTGYPSNSGIVSVTVIAPDGLTADALTTSIFILGKDKGMELAKKFTDVKVEIIEDRDVF